MKKNPTRVTNHLPCASYYQMTRKEYNTSVDLYADGLYRFILKSCSDEDLAKDIVQDVFMKLWDKHENVSYEKVKSYLFTSGHRTLISAFRKEKFKGEYNEEKTEQQLWHNDQYSDLQEILEQALNTLPQIQKSAILLRDYEGYAYDEIAEILGINMSQVKVYIFRGRKALQKILSKKELINA